MRRLFIIGLMCAGCMLAASAQSTFTQRLQQSKTGEGKVTIMQSKEIDDLVNGPKVTIATQQQQTEATPQKRAEDTSALTTAKENKTERPTTPILRQLPDTTSITGDEYVRKKVMKGGYKINGYRVQVFAGGNSRDARVKAERIGKEINALFPGEPVYVHFYSPRWICRMGNYRTYEEAHQALNAVKKLGYKSAIIVKGKITVSYIPPTDPVLP